MTFCNNSYKVFQNLQFLLEKLLSHIEIVFQIPISDVQEEDSIFVFLLSFIKFSNTGHTSNRWTAKYILHNNVLKERQPQNYSNATNKC